MAKKKIPTRKCVGCGERKPQAELCRTVRTKDGNIAYDPTGRSDGRGAYVCKNPTCLLTAKKKRGLERALSGKIPDEVFAVLEAVCAGEKR